MIPDCTSIEGREEDAKSIQSLWRLPSNSGSTYSINNNEAQAHMNISLQVCQGGTGAQPDEADDIVEIEVPVVRLLE